MFSILLRQQTQLASSARLSSPLTRQFLCGLPQSVQKPHILSQRAFSVSRSLSEGGRYRENSGRNSFRDRPPPRRRDPPGPVTKQSTLHVGNLPFSATEAEVREMFESYGQIKRIRLASGSDGRMLGYAFIEFERLEDAVAATESSSAEPFVLLDRTINVTYAFRPALSDEEVPPSTTLLIANYPLPGEETSLRSLLQDYEGHILRINFMKDIHGDDTKKVFVQFSDQETADAALNAFKDYNFEGTPLKMLYARNRYPKRTSKMSDFDA